MQVLVSESARKLNYFPSKHGISQHYSPRMIVHKTSLDYEKHCKYPFGAYVQAHHETNPSNTNAPRALDYIYMRSTETGHEVYNLQTQKIITRRNLTMLPITPIVVKAIDPIAERETKKI